MARETRTQGSEVQKGHKVMIEKSEPNTPQRYRLDKQMGKGWFDHRLRTDMESNAKRRNCSEMQFEEFMYATLKFRSRYWRSGRDCTLCHLYRGLTRLRDDGCLISSLYGYNLSVSIRVGDWDSDILPGISA
jgi:hypothetical protein